MRKFLLVILASTAVFLTQLRPAHARLEEILDFYAQGAGSGVAAIADGLAYNATQLTELGPIATRGAMLTGGTIAGGIAEVLGYDPAIREVLIQQAIHYGRDLGLRGVDFLRAMREYAATPGTRIGERAASLGRRTGAASIEGLANVAGLAIIAGISAYTIHEYYLAYDAEVQASSVDQESFNSNIRLLLAALASKRQNLCPGMTIPAALGAIRRNSDAGRLPFLGVLENCSADRGATPILVGSWQGCDGRVVTFTLRGETVAGRYIAMGRLGQYGFKLGDIGYEFKRHADGTYIGKVLWRGPGDRTEWRNSKITLHGDTLTDTGADSCSGTMTRVAPATGQGLANPPPRTCPPGYNPYGCN